MVSVADEQNPSSFDHPTNCHVFGKYSFAGNGSIAMGVQCENAVHVTGNRMVCWFLIMEAKIQRWQAIEIEPNSEYPVPCYDRPSWLDCESGTEPAESKRVHFIATEKADVTPSYDRPAWLDEQTNGVWKCGEWPDAVEQHGWPTEEAESHQEKHKS